MAGRWRPIRRGRRESQRPGMQGATKGQGTWTRDGLEWGRRGKMTRQKPDLK